MDWILGLFDRDDEPEMTVSHLQEPEMDVPHQKPENRTKINVNPLQEVYRKGTDQDWMVKKIIEHEGYRLDPYTDTTGHITGGIGHKFTEEDFQNFNTSWSDEEKAEYWKEKFREDFAKASRHAVAIANQHDINLNDEKMYVLTDMVFNLGPTGVKGFKNFLADLSQDNIDGAIQEMKYTSKESDTHSKWYKQVPNRVDSLAEILRKANESS
jgi:GH24 family phage-related lysozyme (muramidase)